jgi:ParB family chromosome partitioning protein
MAKKLLINQAGTQAAYADTGLKLSKLIPLEEIEMHEEFQKLFTIDENLLKRIIDSIIKGGYDNSQPVHIWNALDQKGNKHTYLIDGYTRFQAAKKSGLKAIPYFEHKFNDFDEAYKYVLGLQVNRRNLEGNELLKNINILMGTDFIQKTEGKKSEAIAEALDVSPRTVEKAMAVEKNKEAKAKVEAGEMTVNQAYNEIKNKSKKTKKESEKIEDNSGNPGALNFNHSDGIERPVHSATEEDELDKWTKEKNIQVEAAKNEGWEKGFADGFYKAICFVFGEIKKGRSLEDVAKDEKLSDFSPSIISKFELPPDDEELYLNI